MGKILNVTATRRAAGAPAAGARGAIDCDDSQCAIENGSESSSPTLV